MTERPTVAVILAIWRGGEVLYHKRRGGHGAGRWAFPGGHLEMHESFRDCALKELREECGPEIRVTDPTLWTTVNSRLDDKHYVVVVMTCYWLRGEAIVTEPDKCECWEWHPWTNPPRPLMPSQELLLTDRRI